MSDETDYTTITVTEMVKDRLDKQRGATPWSAFLEELRQEYADPITLNDAEEIADHVAENVEGDADASEIALATADYLMTEYNLAQRIAEELEGRQR